MSDSEYASEDAKRYKIKAFRQYRIGMAEIAGIYPDMFIVREMYRMGALPPVFPLPAIKKSYDAFNLGWVSAENGFPIESVFQLIRRN